MKILKEPLLHFALIGALLFAVNAWRESARPRTDGEARIEVTAGTIAWLTESFNRQWHRAPDEAELRGLVNDHVREEVLYREALALGLDRDDTIVRRRMAQKMEFLTQDIATAAVAEDAELREYFEKNPARYAKPVQVSFRHVYFSKQRRGGRLDADAREALAALIHGANEETLGDPFLRELEFLNANEADITATMGGEFTRQLSALPEGEWRGPVESSYGAHLVRVSKRGEAQPVAFETVRDAVVRDLAEERRRNANRNFVEQLKERYEIVVDESAIVGATTTKTATR